MKHHSNIYPELRARRTRRSIEHYAVGLTLGFVLSVILISLL